MTKCTKVILAENYQQLQKINKSIEKKRKKKQ